MIKKFTHYYLRVISFAMLLLCLSSVNAQNDIPEGYYDKANGLAGAELKTALFNIIKVGNRLSYGSGTNSTWSGFEKTDIHPEGYVWDMYSYEERYFPGNGGVPSGMNIEHSVAKSWWGGANNNAYKDLYHLNPSDSKANSARSNYPLGVVKNGSVTGSLKIGNNSYGSEYSGNAFEPLDEYKGDFARAYLYMFTCYEDLTWTSTNAPTMLNNNKYPMLKPWAAKMLLEWSEMDPPSEKEIKRAAEIYKIQNNRNPFIDYPELVEYLWGDKAGEPFEFSSNDDPKIIAPSNNTVFNMPETHYSSTSKFTFTLKAKNLTSPILLTLEGSKKELFSISDSYIYPYNGDIEEEITVVYQPNKVEEISINIVISSQNNEVNERTVVLNAISTEDFYALHATNITDNSFTANWTTISSTNLFEIDVFTKTISGQKEELIANASFDGSLDEGWSKEGYISFSDENGAVRLASNGSNGVISSPKLDLTKDGKIHVTAKKWNSDSGVNLCVGINGEEIETIELENSYQEYIIDFEDATANSTISFTTEKGKRLFIKEVNVLTAGFSIEQNSITGYPINIHNETTHVVNNLQSGHDYYYTVTPLNSDWGKSEEILVSTTGSTTDLNEALSGDIKIYSINNTIMVEGANKDDIICVYNVAGNLILKTSISSESHRIDMDNKGVYVIKIEGINHIETFKVSLYK